MRRRRMIVAFQAIETPQGRMFRELVGGDEIPMGERRKPRGLGVYWCAADKPIEDSSLRLAPVYRTQKIPEEARCEECRIEITKLQEMLACPDA